MYKVFKDNIDQCSGHRHGTYDEYLSFINVNRVVDSREDTIFSVENHHILPRSLCKEIGLSDEVQNSSDNLVLLFPKDHIKAHVLLFKYLRSRKTASAVKAVSNFIKLNKSILILTDEDIVLIAKAKEMAVYSSIKLMNDRLRNLWKDPDWVDKFKKSHLNMSCEAKSRISEGTKRVMSSPEMREKLSNDRKGKKYYTNGKEVKRFLPSEVPDGWIKYYRKDRGISGKRRYTDGIRVKRFFEGEQPEGWVPFKFSDEQIQRLKDSHKNQTVSEDTKHKMSLKRRGKHWFTNGEINTLAYECPQGCYSGMTHHE
jgi:hypothetical protein